VVISATKYSPPATHPEGFNAAKIYKPPEIAKSAV